MQAELFNFTPFASSGDGFNLSATVIDGQPWFSAADVCRSLEIKNVSQAVARLEEDETRIISTYTSAGPRQALAVSEPGLYRLIFTSRKKSAQVFQKWVFSAVLPSLRQHGGYINGQEALSQEAQAEVLPQLHNVVSIARERAQEERDARHLALRLPSSGSAAGAKKAAKKAAAAAAYLAECERIGRAGV